MKECPGCGGPLSFVETSNNRDTFFCEKCDSTVSFGKSVDQITKNKKSKKMNLITLRERPAKHSKEKSVVDDVHADAPPQGKPVEAIRAAMGSKSVVDFAYYSKGAKDPSSRSVEPYKLTMNSAGEIILYGYDLDAGSIRIFKIGRMRGIEKSVFTFTPRWDIVDKLKGKND